MIPEHCGCGHPFGDHEPCRTDGCHCPGYQPCDVCDPVCLGVCAAPYHRSLTASLVLQFCGRPENHDGEHNDGHDA